MEMVLSGGFVELSSNELLVYDGGGIVAAVVTEIFVVTAGVAVIALTPAKKTGVKILVEGSIAAACLYYV